jgi:membrane protein DedA with SNARE-associated domain
VSGYFLAWMLVVLFAAALLGSVWGLYRYSGARRWMALVLPAVFVLLVIPAPIPDYPGFLAPAFLVALFEWAFQEQGKPGVALRMLGIGLVGGVVLAVGAHYLRRFVAARRQPS